MHSLISKVKCARNHSRMLFELTGDHVPLLVINLLTRDYCTYPSEDVTRNQ